MWQPPLLIRADASAIIGAGHVMRCLALAQAWQDAGNRVIFACSELPTALSGRLADEGCELQSLMHQVASDADAAATARLAQEVGASWVVVDGYRFTPEFFEILRSNGFRVMAIDDMVHLERYPVDLLLNQNLSARRRLYLGKCEPETELLLGPRYSLLRREFQRTPPARTPFAGRAKRVLVTFGGSDPPNFTAAILGRLAKVHCNYDVRVLAGSANSHVPTLLTDAKRMPFSCEIVMNAENVAEQMAWADVAISAGGSTVCELAAMRLPALIGAISEDQRIIGPALHRISGFRAWTIEELLKQDLQAEIEAVLTGPQDFGGFDCSGALRVVEQLTHPYSLCESTT